MNFSRLYKILLETPSYAGDIDYRTTQKASELLKASNVEKTHGNKIDTIKLGIFPVDVYERKSAIKSIEYYFKINNKTVAIYFGETFNNKKGIKTDYMESEKGIIQNGSFMGEIYIKFLLKRYQYIMSDTLMTTFGFKFWLNNFDNFINNGLLMYSYDHVNKTLHRLHEKEELSKYYGKETENDYYNYQFIVSTKKL